LIYITGDTHGQIKRFSDKKVKKLKKDDTLIVCGDFGFIWDNSNEEQRKLNELENKKYNILFVDGTHENFDLLEQYPVIDFKGSPAHQIADNIFHLIRGCVYKVENSKIFAFGGGVSHDLNILIDQNCWFEQELPNPDEMMFGVTQLRKCKCKVDYIVTHEPISSIKKRFTSKNMVNDTNRYLDQVFRGVKFDKWFFGSLHLDKRISDNVFAVFDDVIPANKVFKPKKK